MGPTHERDLGRSHERVLPPECALRQWVLSLPCPWPRRLAQDGALLGRLAHLAVQTILEFYQSDSGHSGAVTVVQRTASDLRLDPHLHIVVLDGAWRVRLGEAPSVVAEHFEQILSARRACRAAVSSPSLTNAWTTSAPHWNSFANTSMARGRRPRHGLRDWARARCP